MKAKYSHSKILFCFWKTEKNQIFCSAVYHIGALCSKTLGHFRQALEWSYQKNFCIFPNIIFQKILNLAKKVGNNQVCHFGLIWITLVSRQREKMTQLTKPITREVPNECFENYYWWLTKVESDFWLPLFYKS